jgi:hypothetical protein
MKELQRLLDRLVAAGAPGAAGWVKDDSGARQAASGVADLRVGREEPSGRPSFVRI